MGTRGSRAGRFAIVMSLGVIGALSAAGCVLAGLFELQGFGGPRDSDPRALYLCGLAILLTASLGLPLLVWRALLPQSPPGWLLGAVPVGAAVLLLLGLGASR
ncbi:MAG: hypothetical protein ACR2LG_02740 [Actinomycetota bacterium]|nr:hypothetical protein [Actinomycetota bacterium]